MENVEENMVAENQAHYNRFDVIAEWKRRRAEDIREFEEKVQSPEYRERMKDVKGKIVRYGSTEATT